MQELQQFHCGSALNKREDDASITTICTVVTIDSSACSGETHELDEMVKPITYEKGAGMYLVCKDGNIKR